MSAVPDPGMRAADSDREAVVERLQEAHAEGRLSQDELVARVEAAYTARTFGELAPLTADLPGTSVPARRPDASAGREPVRRGSAEKSLRTAWAAWGTAVSVNLVIWLIVTLSTIGDEGWPPYFWPVWVAGPWGAVLVVATLAARGRR